MSAMKFYRNLVLLPLFVGLYLTAGAQERRAVVGFHTTVERLFNLEDGMSLSQVNQTLGSEPHDLLQNTEKGYMMLEYRYLKAYRTVKSSEVDTESGRIVGEPHYKEASSVYLMFNNENRLVSYVTADALGEIEHQYKLERTASRLGATNAPCTRNCKISIPGQEVVEAGEEAPQEEPEEEVVIVERASGFSGLFGGVRDAVAAVTSGTSETSRSAQGYSDGAVGPKKDSYRVGENVWMPLGDDRVKGQVIQTMGSRGIRVKYVHPQMGVKTKLCAVADVWSRD